MSKLFDALNIPQSEIDDYESGRFIVKKMDDIANEVRALRADLVKCGALPLVNPPWPTADELRAAILETSIGRVSDLRYTLNANCIEEALAKLRAARAATVSE